MREGNILSFKILVDSKGMLITELSGLPESEVKKVFDTENDRAIIQKIIKEGLLKLETLHDYLEKEITKLSKSDYEKEVIKDDYSNDYEKWFEETKGEYCIVKCKEIFTNKNIVHDPFGFHRAINWNIIGSELKPTKEKGYYEIKELT